MSLLTAGSCVRNALPQTPVPYGLPASIENGARMICSTIAPVPATGFNQIESGSASRTTVAADLPLYTAASQTRR